MRGPHMLFLFSLSQDETIDHLFFNYPLQVFYWGLLHCASVQTQYLWQFTTIQNMDWCSPFSAWQQFAGRSVSIEIELALKKKRANCGNYGNDNQYLWMTIRWIGVEVGQFCM